jgi:hypothetical protein
MTEPFNPTLHEIMLRRGYAYSRRTEFALPLDCYEKEGRLVSYDDGDYVVMTEADGLESVTEIFDRETEGLFAPKHK